MAYGIPSMIKSVDPGGTLLVPKQPTTTHLSLICHATAGHHVWPGSLLKDLYHHSPPSFQ